MDESSFQAGQMKSTQVVDMNPVDSLYIYCDVMEPGVVGDKQVPLLRIIPAEGDHGQLMTRIYEKRALCVSSTEKLPDDRNQYKGPDRKYRAIRAGDVERDTSFPST